MKYSIVLTETAQADLSAIFKYIAVDLQSVQNANVRELRPYSFSVFHYIHDSICNNVPQLLANF